MKGGMLLLLALLAMVYTGVEVADTAHQVRRSHAELESVRKQQDQALTRHSQLLLEIGAVASLAHVQSVAEQQLEMRFPQRQEVRTKVAQQVP